MTNQEFSDAFDVAVQAYNPHIQFNEYEKSVFLTKAQNIIVQNLYTGQNTRQESFEQSEELRRKLSNLIVSTQGTEQHLSSEGINKKSKIFELPKDIMYIIQEYLELEDSDCISEIEVVPVTYDEYNRIIKNPFKGINNYRALRLDIDNKTVDIISTYSNYSYWIKYLKNPSPIVLIDLEGVSINNQTNKTECELSEVLHEDILELAVKLAIASRGVQQST